MAQGAVVATVLHAYWNMPFCRPSRNRMRRSLYAFGMVLNGLSACAPAPLPRTLDCAAGGCRPAADTRTTALATADAVVDFSVDAEGTFPRNGFLLSVPSLEQAGARYDAIRAALDAGTWRVGSTRQAETAIAAGTRPTLLLYEAWRDQFPGRTPTSWPFDDYAKFESWLRPLARAHRQLPVTWEVWNEWDTGLPWWGGTESQLFETYAVVERVLRQEVGPNVDVAGPSFARYDTLRFRRFADYCLAAGCRVDTWTWHELAPGTAGSIVEHLRWVRAAFVSDSAYAPLRVRRLDINEVVAQAERYSPAALVTTLRALHDGGADAFGRSCWREVRSRQYECLNGSFDGIVDTVAQAPRVTAWVHAAYARIREDPVGTTASGRIALLAGRGAGTGVPAVVLIAPSNASRVDQSITLELRRPARSGVEPTGKGERRVVVRRLSWKLLDAPVEALPVELEATVADDAEAVRLHLLLPGIQHVPDRDADPLFGRDAFLVSIESLHGTPRFLWPVAARLGRRP